MNDDDGRKLSLFIALQQEGLTSDEAERRVLALMPLDAAFAPGSQFEEQVQRRSQAFSDSLSDVGAKEADELAIAELGRLRELANSLGERYYAERFDRVLAGVANESSAESPSTMEQPEQDWPTITCPICGQAGSIHPDEESPFAYRPGHLAFWTRECRQCGEWFAVEKRDPSHVERVDADVRSFVEDTIHELGMNRWPSATGGEPANPTAAAPARARPKRDSPGGRLRRYGASPKGRLVGAATAIAAVAGGITAGLLVSAGDDPSPPATSANGRVVVAAERSWKSREITLTRDGEQPARRRVVVRTPAAARIVQIRVERSEGTPPPLLITGSGKAAESRPLPNGRARVRLPDRQAQRRVVVVLRAAAGEGVVTLTVRVRAPAGPF